jgi:hypothetical protein
MSVSDNIRAAARGNSWEARVSPPPSESAQAMSDWIRRRSGRVPSAPPAPEADPVVAEAARLGFLDPELAARAVAGEAGTPTEALGGLARHMPTMVRRSDSGLGPRGTAAGLRPSTSTVVNAALREAVGRSRARRSDW